MKLQRLHIKNFKSIVDLEIVEPNPFTVFVGPNGSGKSNIFEALEFFSMGDKYRETTIELFRGTDSFINFSSVEKSIKLILFLEIEYITECYFIRDKSILSTHTGGRNFRYDNSYKSPEFEHFVRNFSRIFVNNEDVEKVKLKEDSRLSLSASNLAKVLKRTFQDEIKREEMIEWLQLLIPEFENIEITTDDFDGESKLRIYERHTKRPFPKFLISDGIFNILALLTAVYQSDEPQFLCIEEPENGLTPYVIEQFVELFRNVCQEKGHYIWLNTHSPTLVRNLRADELIVVDKKQGATQIKQFKGKDYFGLRMDEAWLTNALGGGLPW
jgi:predicted ATPase